MISSNDNIKSIVVHRKIKVIMYTLLFIPVENQYDTDKTLI